ncbi:hypothetical protein NEUTE1DRAFT_113573 [Neurospora tetrasperma FGSC 2508]|uniref:Uncharacterized protein n=1 Tax=Neurospora tetrasperma (strain FGSC 2508 / ATCC MYA-4615 / P0657) TaxID=510951 RepID=F8MY20_NEUT8|nr:uncharacterized protein NEUTE1DRAFT_113573 [Neurospora tetrasperma FGSC 2508]EGO51502.1 hypothetical protein NEUTE1DRAFT_113573 [Neurospora tetrasperma FGSC 2508]
MGWLQSGLGCRRTLQTIEIAILDASVLPDALRESTVDSRFSLFSDSCHFVFHYSSDPRTTGESVDRIPPPPPPPPPLSVRVQYANRSLERHALYIADHSGTSKIARKRLGNINKSSRYCTAHPASSVRSKSGSQTATRSQSVFIWYALCVRREQSTDRPALDVAPADETPAPGPQRQTKKFPRKQHSGLENMAAPPVDRAIIAEKKGTFQPRTCALCALGKLSETNLSGSGCTKHEQGLRSDAQGNGGLKRGGAVGGVSFDSYKHLHVRFGLDPRHTTDSATRRFYIFGEGHRAGDGRDYRGFPSRLQCPCVLHSIPSITVGILFQFANGALASEWWCSKEWSLFYQAIPVQVKSEFHGSIVE